MTTKTTAPKYDYKVAKETEIAALRAFRAQFSDQTFMATFLDEKTIEYFAEYVRHDFPPAMRENLEKRVRDEQSGRLTAEMDAAVNRDEVSKLKGKVFNQNTTIERLDRYVAELEKGIKDAEGRFVDKCEELSDAEQTIADRDAEIIRLKAMIFDLEHAAK